MSDCSAIPLLAFLWFDAAATTKHVLSFVVFVVPDSYANPNSSYQVETLLRPPLLKVFIALPGLMPRVPCIETQEWKTMEHPTPLHPENKTPSLQVLNPHNKSPKTAKNPKRETLQNHRSAGARQYPCPVAAVWLGQCRGGIPEAPRKYLWGLPGLFQRSNRGLGLEQRCFRVQLGIQNPGLLRVLSGLYSFARFILA